MQNIEDNGQRPFSDLGFTNDKFIVLWHSALRFMPPSKRLLPWPGTQAQVDGLRSLSR